MRQLEQTKKEYIERLKRELDAVEGKYQQIVNDNLMYGEDYRSQALHNLEINIKLSQEIAGLKEEIEKRDDTIEERNQSIREGMEATENELMRIEEWIAAVSAERAENERINAILTETED